jgi:cytochrome c-type biogenesis protein CcmH
MVAGLDEKLRSDPNDPDGWMRLLRSYRVLGKDDAARDALKRALVALGAESEAGKRLAAFAVEQGVAQ